MALPFFRSSHFLPAAFLAAALVTTPFAAGRKKEPSGPLDGHKRAEHALNRLTFGPRPGDVARVSRVGVDKWIEQQLHPERIDDSALEGRLAQLGTLRMNTRQIVENFPNNEIIRQVANGKIAMPSDPTLRAIYTAQVQRLDDKQ